MEELNHLPELSLEEMREQLKKVIDILPEEQIREMWNKVKTFATIMFNLQKGVGGPDHN